MMSKHEFKHILSTHCNRHLSHIRPIAFRMHADSASITCLTLFFCWSLSRARTCRSHP